MKYVSIGFLQKSFSFSLRAQTPDMRKMQHSPHENVFFKGTLSRHRRQSDDDPGTKNNDKCRSTNRGIQRFFVRVPQGPAAKMPRNGSPEPLREPPGPSRPSPGRLKSINFSAQVATRRRPMVFFVPKYRKSRRSGLLVLLVSSGLVVRVVPGGCVQFPRPPRG